MGLFHQRSLCGACQIAGIDIVKLHPQLLILLQRRFAVAIVTHGGGLAQAARMAGKHHGGHSHRLQAAHGQHGGNGIISGASKSGKIMDAKHGFGCWKNHKRVPSFYTGCPRKADHKKIPVDLPLCFCLLPSGSTTYTDTFYHKCGNKKR